MSIDELIGRKNDFELSNNLNFDSNFNNSPINKHVDWKLSDLNKIDFKTLKQSNELYNTDTKYLEGYNYFDAEKNIDYYLICRYESNPCELNREIPYCWCNPAYKLTVISKNSNDIMFLFDYLHDKYSNISGQCFLANNQR